MSKILIDRAVVEQALDWFDWLYTGEPVEMMVEQKSADIRQALRTALAEQPASLDWVSLNKAADEIVRSKPTWKRFIDGTPLANDIACWMAYFALEHTAPQPAKREPLTDGQIAEIAATPCAVVGSYVHTFARAIEAAHGITKE